MKKLLLILLCLPLLYSCNSGWSINEIFDFKQGCLSTPLPAPYSESIEEYCECLLEQAMETYPRGTPPSSEWDKDWAKESARKCLLDIAGEEYLEDNEEDKEYWTSLQKDSLLNTCIKSCFNSSPSALESEVKKYCDCILEKTMIKYNKPTDNMDMQWFNLTSKECFAESRNEKNTKKDTIFNKSFKKQISAGDIDKNEIEYFDESTRVYSNFKYGISFKETRGWDIDYGVGQYTIYRATQRDSAYTFAINVIEVDVSPEEGMSIHKMVDMLGIEAYKSQMVNMMSKNANADIYNVLSKKTHLKNFPAMRTVFNQNVKDGDDEIVFTNIIYQLMRENFTITCAFSAPQFLYEEDKQSINEIFQYIHLLNIKKP